MLAYIRGILRLLGYYLIYTISKIVYQSACVGEFCFNLFSVRISILTEDVESMLFCDWISRGNNLNIIYYAMMAIDLRRGFEVDPLSCERFLAVIC